MSQLPALPPGMPPPRQPQPEEEDENKEDEEEEDNDSANEVDENEQDEAASQVDAVMALNSLSRRQIFQPLIDLIRQRSDLGINTEFIIGNDDDILAGLRTTLSTRSLCSAGLTWTWRRRYWTSPCNTLTGTAQWVHVARSIDATNEILYQINLSWILYHINLSWRTCIELC